jgi:hypothetical protein
MSIIANPELLKEKLKTELRSCAKCNLVIENPFIERCPRCFSHLQRVNVDCEGCAQKILCPTGKYRKFTPQQSDS